MKKRTSQDTAQDVTKTLDHLFGSEEDLTDEELSLELAALGMRTETLEETAYKRLRQLASERFSWSGQALPSRLATALRELRPPSAEEEKAKTTVFAKRALQDIFRAVAQPNILTSLTASASEQPAFSFRSKGDLTASDQELLESEQAEVDDD